MSSQAASPWPEGVRSRVGASQVSPAWVQANLSAVVVVDVREPHEVAGPMPPIQGAELVPLGQLLLGASRWSTADALVLICRSGMRSDRGAVALEGIGFQRVSSMTGGMLAWPQHGRAVAG